MMSAWERILESAFTHVKDPAADAIMRMDRNEAIRYLESCGLTKEGTTPIPVMTIIDGKHLPKIENDEPLYYKNIKLKLAPQAFELDENNQPIDLMKEKFTQPNERRTQWKAVFVKDDPNNINEAEIDVPMLESGDLQGFCELRCAEALSC